MPESDWTASVACRNRKAELCFCSNKNKWAGVEEILSGDEKLSVTESVLAIPAELFFRGQENFVFKIISDRFLPMVQINTIAFFIRYCIVWAGFTHLILTRKVDKFFKPNKLWRFLIV